MALRSSIILALAAVLLAFTALPSAANDSNILLTGDVLDTDASLTNPAASFTMQDDCNLVLYPAEKSQGFVSGTNARGGNCTVTVNSYGQLVIRRGDGNALWSTPASNKRRGRYAAVLRPDGQVAIYGPMVWSTPTRPSPPAPAPVAGGLDAELSAVPMDPAPVAGGLDAELSAVPMDHAKNVLFSGQILYNDAKLETRDYSFVMRSDCELALTKALEGDVWSSGTKNVGQHCFVRVGHRGELAVVDDRYRTVWSSRAESSEGEYVVVLQINGQAAVYGPVVWSTASRTEEHEQ